MMGGRRGRVGRCIVASVLCAVLAVSCFMGSAAYAAAGARLASNTGSSKAVSISFTDESIAASGKTLAVLPGGREKCLCQVQSNGASCYVRVKTHMTGPFVYESFLETKGDWFKAADGYWYRRAPLAYGERATLVDTLYVPTSIPNAAQGTSFTFSFTAEAVQESNYPVNWNASSPWGDIDIEKARRDGTADTGSSSQSKDLDVRYDPATGKMISTTDNYFANFPALMPGDSFTDTIVLRNPTSHDLKMYIDTKKVAGNALYKQAQLRLVAIINGVRTVIYEGTVAGFNKNARVFLGTLSAYSKGMLLVTLSLPETVGNKVAGLPLSCSWKFDAEELPDPLAAGRAGYPNVYDGAAADGAASDDGLTQASAQAGGEWMPLPNSYDVSEQVLRVAGWALVTASAALATIAYCRRVRRPDLLPTPPAAR